MQTLTTSELFTRRALGSAADEDAVAWAAGQLAGAPPLPNLATLASLRAPLNHFEVEDLLRRSLLELGLHEPPIRETYLSFLRTTARAVLDGAVSPREGCSTLAGAHGGDLDRTELLPFWFLAMGLHDLEVHGNQWYEPGLTLETFDERVRSAARRLLAASSGDRCAG